MVYANNSKLSSINGIVVDWEDYGNTTQMTEQVNKYPHLDLSPMFPSFMQLQRPADQTYYNNKVIDDCINGFNRSTQADNWLKHKLANDPGYKVENNRLVSCPYPTQRNKTGAPCFYSIISEQQFNRYSKKGGKRKKKKSITDQAIKVFIVFVSFMCKYYVKPLSMIRQASTTISLNCLIMAMKVKLMLY